MECRSGPRTILTDEEEQKLIAHLITMADMGYGVKRHTVMKMAFMIAEKNQKQH